MAIFHTNVKQAAARRVGERAGSKEQRAIVVEALAAASASRGFGV